MSRLSREKKREQKHAGSPAAVTAPLDVQVRGGVGGTGGAATIGGVPVAAADGEEIQRAVLGHLHRIALATGHSVLATVHDERIGYVVPLRVDPDGSSHFAAEPLRAPAAPVATTHAQARAEAPAPTPAPPVVTPASAPVSASAQVQAPPPPVAAPLTSAPVAPAADPDGRPSEPRRDSATHLLRQVSEPVRDVTPTFPVHTVPEAEAEAARTPGSHSDPAPTYALRAVPESAPEPAPESQGPRSSGSDSGEFPGEIPAPGTVAVPTGVFGPPPAMDEQPNPETATPASPETVSPPRTPIE
ncbi:hypothetical protein PYK79_48980, partial [Streptomyces sp. ID05-04B]|nr:hypothetical protein [Streptomyces sp. ID05-04B]